MSERANTIVMSCSPMVNTQYSMVLMTSVISLSLSLSRSLALSLSLALCVSMYVVECMFKCVHTRESMCAYM